MLPQTLYFEITDPDVTFLALKSLSVGIIDEDELRKDANLRDGRIFEAN